MKVEHVLGADLSKRTVDLVHHQTGTHLQIPNDPAGFKQLTKWLRQQGWPLSATLVVMEHTGLYGFLFEGFLHRKALAFTKVPALEIKRSLGLQRGKSDRVDARRIAAYGHQRRDTLAVEAPVDKDLQRLALLQATRKRLVEQRAALKCSLKEYGCIGLKKADPVMAAQQRVMKVLDAEIKRLETEIGAVLQGNEALKKTVSLLRSVPGVGPVLAVQTLLKTRNFTLFAKPKKFGCCVGTAPFEHTSGTSVRGKTRVSHLADKTLKTLLDLAAKSAIQHDKELNAYYQRRLQMGKSKMSTLNVVRNKIICRMFAVVKRGTPFQENYQRAA